MNQTSHNDADHFGKKNLHGDLFKDWKFYGCQYNVLCLWDKDGFSMINIYVYGDKGEKKNKNKNKNKTKTFQ
jgi:hypothetical protein